MTKQATTWDKTIQASNTNEYREIKQVLNGRGGFGGYAKEPRSDSSYSKQDIINMEYVQCY